MLIVVEAPDRQYPADGFGILDWNQVQADERATLQLSDEEQPTALCLSGGGIRSAAFCLGVLQAFAARKLLRQFHYLSTVSGGGYIGGWVTRCIAQQNTPKTKGNSSVEAVEECILAEECKQDAPEAPQLDRLRRYTNFLTPHPGLASTDTAAGVVLWLRNTLINWAIFLPLMLALTLAPILYLIVVRGSAASPAFCLYVAAGAGILGVLSLLWAVYQTCINLPSYNELLRPRSQKARPGFGLEDNEALQRIVVWTLAWTLLAPLSFAPLLLLLPPEPSGSLETALYWLEPAPDRPLLPLLYLPVANFFACVIAYALAWLRLGNPEAYVKSPELVRTAFYSNIGGWIVSSALSAFVLWLGAWLVMHLGGGVRWVAIAGPVWVMGAEMLRSAAYSAVRKEGLRSDLDREWLARLSGQKSRIVLAFGALGTTAVFLPTLILDHFGEFEGWIVAAVGFLSGPVAALLGTSAQTAFSTQDTNQKAVPLNWVLGVAISLFAVTLFMLLGKLAMDLITVHITNTLPWIREDAAPLLPNLFEGGRLTVAFVKGLLALCGFLLVAQWLDSTINLNRFSMHAVYRNRLVRAFLGTARDPAERHPDHYTEFDPEDNVRVVDTFARGKQHALFPVINVTLNRTSGQDTARAERKAEPFTITPLHCGSPLLDKRPDVPEGRRTGAYVPTRFFAGGDRETGPEDLQNGITLGTAMAISGAAVSPNMGYHSSPLVAFVMTLFNVRLGAWLPNPGTNPPPSQTMMQRSGPSKAMQTMIQDLLGHADDQDEFVYLSDGGHFDNLGLYEMLSRRCGKIVVVDAGGDGHYGYSDLRRSLQQAQVDLGVQVDFEPRLKVGDKTMEQYGAYASITYSEDSRGRRQTGELIYIKPWLPDGVPSELKAFKQQKDSFPHETTANQFFTESDFESYRRLGQYLAAEILTAAAGKKDVAPKPTLDVVMSGVRQLAAHAAKKNGNSKNGAG
jgi:hypothetical protein